MKFVEHSTDNTNGLVNESTNKKNGLSYNGTYMLPVCVFHIIVSYANRIIGNALTGVHVFTSQTVVFRPFEAGVYPGITRTRNFCEFCTTLVPVPELSICILSTGYTQNHTRGIYNGYHPTNDFCKFCRTLIPVPGASASSVRPLYNTRNFWKYCKTFIPVLVTSGSSVRLSYPHPKLLWVLYDPCHGTRGTGTACFVSARNFCELFMPVPQYPELLWVL